MSLCPLLQAQFGLKAEVSVSLCNTFWQVLFSHKCVIKHDVLLNIQLMHYGQTCIPIFFHWINDFIMQVLNYALSKDPQGLWRIIYRILLLLLCININIFSDMTVYVASGISRKCILFLFKKQPRQSCPKWTYQSWSGWRSCRRSLKRHCSCCCWVHGLQQAKRSHGGTVQYWFFYLQQIPVQG